MSCLFYPLSIVCLFEMMLYATVDDAMKGDRRNAKEGCNDAMDTHGQGCSYRFHSRDEFSA